MLDMGVYPVSFAHWVLGDVEVVRAIGQPANDASARRISATLGHVGGSQAVMNTTIMADTPRDATIAGEHGYLSIAGPDRTQPGPFTVFLRDAEPMFYLGLRDGHEGGLHFSRPSRPPRSSAQAQPSSSYSIPRQRCSPLST